VQRTLKHPLLKRMRKLLVAALHIGYWLFYGLLLFVIFAVMFHSEAGHVANPPAQSLVFFVFTSAPALFGFYTFYFYLFPSYVQKKKYGLMVPVALGCAALSGLASSGVLSATLGPRIMFADGWQSYIEETISMGFLAFIHGVIAIVLHGFVAWFDARAREQKLVEQNLSMELSLVKGQIHPHFLFNTLSNIDVLVEKDSKLASKYLNKLSDLLRFMVFETKPDKIALEKELGYIEEYIDLQRLRAIHPDYVRYTINGDIGNTQVPPMLFLPFIENAFKYSEALKSQPAITISFDVKTGTIDFVCENKYSAFTENTLEQGGVGLAIIQKRLQLLYPGRHTLSLKKDIGHYSVHLTLQA